MAGIHWPGLLEWSTRHHDGTAPSNFSVLSGEDREFLEGALQDAFGKIEDTNQIFKEAIDQVKPDAENRTDASIVTALEIMDRCCDDRDVARNAEKLGGVQALLDLAVSYTGPIRVRTLEILALLFSNNPEIQKVGHDRGALKVLMDLVNAAPKHSEEFTKSFRTLVALARSMEDMEKEFVDRLDGVAVLCRCLDVEEDPRLREKAASFARSLLGEGGHKDTDGNWRAGESRLDAEGTGRIYERIALLVPGMGEHGLQYQETLASTISEVAVVCPKPPAGLQAAIEERQKQIAQNPECETEREIWEATLARLKGSAL